MTIHTTWREIAGLTAEQIATLQGHAARCSDATLQSMARECVKHNATQQRYAHIPVPAGAVSVDPWDQQAAGTRTFTGSSWQIPVAEGDPWIVLTAATIVVEISGTQRADGTITRWVVTIFPPGGCEDRYDLPLATARMLSESLAAAADECERMNAADGGATSSFPVFSR